MDLEHKSSSSVFTLAEQYSEVPSEFVKNLRKLDGACPPNFYDGILLHLVGIINDHSRLETIKTLAEKNTNVRERNATVSLVKALSSQLPSFYDCHLSEVFDVTINIPDTFRVKIPRIYRNELRSDDIFLFNLLENDLGAYRNKIINSFLHYGILSSKPGLFQSRKFLVSAPVIDQSIKKRRFSIEEITKDNILDDENFRELLLYLKTQWKIYLESPTRKILDRRDQDLFAKL